MSDIAALQHSIEAQFRLIASTRMAGIPVVNAALVDAEHEGVAMRGLVRLGGSHVGILVTPWFMNLVFLPVEMPEPAPRIGAKAHQMLPSGSYECIWNVEDAIGGYWSCSLFSPMFEFADMEGAIAVADAAMEELMARPGKAEENDAFEAAVMPAQPRDVDSRLEEIERAERKAAEAAKATQNPLAKDEAIGKPRPDLDRRALFGLSRRESEDAA